MMQWKKPIRNNSNFTPVRVLAAFSYVAVSCVLSMPVISALQRLQEPVYYNEDHIAMYQLRSPLVQSSRLSLQKNTLSFIYQEKKQTLEYGRRRLVRRSSYGVFLQDVGTLWSQKREECYYVTWVRKEKREEVLSTCK